MRPHGFTLAELIVTVLILSILAVVVIPRLDRHDYDTLRFYDQSLAAVRYAQKVAIAQRAEVFVSAAPAALTVCFDAGCGAPVIDPATGAALMVTAPGGVTLSMSQPVFSFTGLGSTSGVAAPVVVTVSGSPVRSFTVEQETGYVHP
jgi:MSHA pilin protein MshC